MQRIEEENSDYDDESELGDKVPLPAKLVVNRLPSITNNRWENEEQKVEHKSKNRSLKQSKDLWYDQDYDMDKDDAIQSQI